MLARESRPRSYRRLPSARRSHRGAGGSSETPRRMWARWCLAARPAVGADDEYGARGGAAAVGGAGREPQPIAARTPGGAEPDGVGAAPGPAARPGRRAPAAHDLHQHARAVGCRVAKRDPPPRQRAEPRVGQRQRQRRSSRRPFGTRGAARPGRPLRPGRSLRPGGSLRSRGSGGSLRPPREAQIGVDEPHPIVEGLGDQEAAGLEGNTLFDRLKLIFLPVVIPLVVIPLVLGLRRPHATEWPGGPSGRRGRRTELGRPEQRPRSPPGAPPSPLRGPVGKPWGELPPTSHRRSFDIARPPPEITGLRGFADGPGRI